MLRELFHALIRVVHVTGRTADDDVHFVRRAAHAFERRRLFLGSRSDARDELRTFGGAVADDPKRLGSVLCELRALRDGFRGVLHGRDVPPRLLLYLPHSPVDFLRRVNGFFGKLADLVGDDGKTAPSVTGSRRFDGGIQGKKVGLVGDVLDDRHDPSDAFRVGAELVETLRRARCALPQLVDRIRHLAHDELARLASSRALSAVSEVRPAWRAISEAARVICSIAAAVSCIRSR